MRTSFLKVQTLIIASTFFAALNMVIPVHCALAEATDETEQALMHAQSLSHAFENAAKIIRPSVVNVTSSKKPKAPKGLRRNGGPMMDPNSPLKDFFGDDLFERFGAPQGPGGGAQQGLGTGVIVSANGNIITNNHVVENADEIKVRLSDNKTYTAKLVGADPRTDLAVIKIEADGLTPAVLGNSDDLKIGEWVIASGNPFGLENTITTGIVSAKGRSSITDPNQYEDFIQTDAAINPGNSGGPLINLRGQVVGINTAILSRTGGYMGIGFAIPANMTKSVMESLIKNGKVTRGWLGVVIQNLDENLAKSFSYSGTEGALVGDVADGTPAEKGGIKQGDIVVSFDGKKIVDVNQLRNSVADVQPGKTVDIVVHRDGAKKTLAVKIGEQEGQVSQEKPVDEASADLGITLQPLSPAIASELGIKDSRPGVIVTQVDPSGLAASAGVRPKDIIRSVNGNSVKDVPEFNAMVKKSGTKNGLRLVVESNGAERFVFIRAEE